MLCLRNSVQEATESSVSCQSHFQNKSVFLLGYLQNAAVEEGAMAEFFEK